MKSWNYDAPKMALEVRVSYFWSLFGPDGTEVYGPTRVQLWELRGIRDARAGLGDKGWRVKVERDVQVWPVEACHYCQARPCITEWDCDGPYRRVVCDDEQCNRGNNIDNADWVAGKAPIWGPGHPEWDQWQAERIGV